MRYEEAYILSNCQKASAPKSLPVTYEEWEYEAQKILPPGPFDYIAGGAGSEDTMRANREAFRHWRIQPQALKDVSTRNLAVTLLGDSFPAPFLLAPVGLQGIAHPEGELGTARAAADLGIPFILSTVSSYSLEDTANVMGNSPRWFQLYWPKSPEITKSFLARAEKSGYTVLVLTIDYPVHPWRERNIHNNYAPFKVGQGMKNFTTDPIFRAMLKQSPDQNVEAAISLFNSLFPNPHSTWNDLDFLRKHTRLPIMLKGILNPKDAERALYYGIDGIIVSNHGGREVDGELAALKALPMICNVVKGRVPVLMDSGIRGGADVIKALALGATAVLLGRPYMYGLAVGGAKGVKQVMTNLISDISITMATAGIASISEIDPSVLVQI